jgi:Rrf2 family protein
MKLTRSVSYAVGVLLQIKELGGDGQITAAKIARGCRFPPRFLYRILRRLVDAGLLHGTSGPGGGYALAKSPQRITLWDIVKGVEATPEASVLKPVCANQRRAILEVNRVCRRNAERFAADLRQLSLAKLGRLEGRASKRKKKPRARSSQRSAAH